MNQTRRSILGALFVGLVVAAFAVNASAQGFNALHSPDGTDVWAVGDAGAVFRSLDGGATWGSYPLGSVDHNGVASKGTNVWIVDNGGALWSSTNSGSSFSSSSPVGAIDLNAIWFADASNGWVVGDAGTILATTNAGATWLTQESGTGVNLHCVRFASTTDGWSVGASGTVLRTTNGGTSWTSSTPFTFTKALYDVDLDGSTVYISGTYGFLGKSTDGGTNWTEPNLMLDAKSDVNGVEVLPGGALWLCGGGGFLRKSVDGASTWTFPKHTIVTGLTDVTFYDANKGWACAGRSKNVVRTTDGGATWSVPGGGTFSYAWSLKVGNGASSIRGDTFDIHPTDRDILFVVQGLAVYRSTNRGDTWTSVATITGGGSKTNSFYVSPTDPDNVWVAAVQSTDRVTKTTNAGATWVTKRSVAFTEYGMPLEQDINNPNTLYFGPEDGQLHKSTDFGETWTIVSDPNFRSPCDIVVVGGSPNTILVGDGVTSSGNGQMFRSTDSGASFALIYTGAGSEIPTIGASWIDGSIAFATHWSSGGVHRTTNFGASWVQSTNTGSAWGSDVAKDDPFVSMFGTYSGGSTYLSTNSGTSFLQQTPGGSNYAVLTYDRGTYLAHHSGGVYKASVSQPDMTTNNAQGVVVVSPNGTETWTYNEVRPITWSSTNVAAVKIEYETSAIGPWQLITASTPGPAGSYPWTIPNAPTTLAKIRVSDAGDATPIDESNLPFNILVPNISTVQSEVAYGDVAIGSAKSDTVRIVNNGTATLVISAVIIKNGGPFTPSRTSFSIPAGASDTIAVSFNPAVIQSYEDVLRFDSNAPTAEYEIPLTGNGIDAAVLALSVPDGGEEWQYNTQHAITWSSNLVSDVKIEYETSGAGPWIEIAASVPAVPASYNWTIPNNATTDAKVRVTDIATPSRFDISSAPFSITVQALAANPGSIDFGGTPTSTTSEEIVVVSNPGTAPLTVLSVSSDSAAFVPAPTSFVVAPGATDTVTVAFTPTEERAYSGTLTIVTDAPSPNATVTLAGTGTSAVGVASNGALPTRFELRGSSPNPFGGQGTAISYALPKESRVSLVVYNAAGQEVATLVDRRQSPGVYSVSFPNEAVRSSQAAGSMPSGVYFYRLTAEEFTQTKQMVLVR